MSPGESPFFRINFRMVTDLSAVSRGSKPGTQILFLTIPSGFSSQRGGAEETHSRHPTTEDAPTRGRTFDADALRSPSSRLRCGDRMKTLAPTIGADKQHLHG